MEGEQEQRTNWAIWIILPVCVAGTVFLTKWLLTRKAGPPAALVEEYNVITPRNEERTEYAAGPRPADPPARTYSGGSLMAPVSLEPGAGARKASARPAGGEPPPAGEPDAKDSSKLGFTYGALSRAVGKVMNKPVVRRALDNPAVVQAAVSSGLVAAILDTPGGRSLMNDPAAMRDIITANPELTNLLANPNVVNALLNNPRTAGLLGLAGPAAGR